LSCPCFCTRSRPEMYYTGYLWAPLHPSDSTHLPTVFSESSPSSLNGPLPRSKPTRPLATQTPKTPTRPKLRTLILISFESLRLNPLSGILLRGFPAPSGSTTPCLRTLSSPSKLSGSRSRNLSQLSELASFLWFMFPSCFLGLEALSRPSLCRQT